MHILDLPDEILVKILANAQVLYTTPMLIWKCSPRSTPDGKADNLKILHFFVSTSIS